MKSTLTITQGDKVIGRLHPRQESAPEVLFDDRADLAAGRLQAALGGDHPADNTKAIEGDIPFKVSDQPPQ